MDGSFQSIFYLICSSLLVFAISEVAWWTSQKTTFNTNDIALMLVFYFILTSFTIILARLVHVTTLSGTFILGAIFGWMAEGLMAGTIFANPLLGITWTALAWHALLSIVGGLYLLPLLLKTQTFKKIILWGAVCGLVLGMHATGSIPSDSQTVPGETWVKILFFVLLISLLVPTIEFLRPSTDSLTSKKYLFILGGISLIYFLFSYAFAIPWSAPLMGVLFLSAFWLLYIDHKTSPSVIPGIFAPRPKRIGIQKILFFSSSLLISAVSVTSLLGFFSHDAPSWILFFILAPAGVIAYGASAADIIGRYRKASQIS